MIQVNKITALTPQHNRPNLVLQSMTTPVM